MSQVNRSSLDSFVERVRQAQRSRAKNVTLTLEEAQELILTMSQLLSRDVGLLEQIVELQKNATGPVEVQMGGGTFK